ncbi:hypothetical protein [Rhizobium sp. F40D2]
MFYVLAVGTAIGFAIEMAALRAVRVLALLQVSIFLITPISSNVT